METPTVIEIINEKIDLESIIDTIVTPYSGAAVIFTGHVRRITKEGKSHEITSLEYEAYLPMAKMKLKQIADEIRIRWPRVEGVAIVQRIGHLAPGIMTVIIACSAAHRDYGLFEAARYGIDRLKEIVPIWKKEFGSEGEYWVEGNYLPKPGKD